MRFRATDQHFFLHDDNFNVTAAYDVKPTSGTYRQVVERYRYTPYGQAIILDANFAVGAANGTISDIGNNYLYTGRERDPETGLQLNRMRYLHLELGRWLTRDPIGYDGSPWNLYEYAVTNPLRHTDPSGLDCPGCDGFPHGAVFENHCNLACCALHDLCFDIHDCSARYNRILWMREVEKGGVLGFDLVC